MFEKQGQHYFLLIVLLLGVYFLATGDVLSGQLWGHALHEELRQLHVVDVDHRREPPLGLKLI